MMLPSRSALTRQVFGPERCSPMRRHLTEAVAVAAILLAFIAAVSELILREVPFGTDEAVYAVKAREGMALGKVSDVWADYRAPGLPWIIRPFVDSGSSESIPRFTVATFGLLAVVSTWVVGRCVFGPMAGVIAAFGLSCTPAFLSASGLVWPDIPGTALGMCAFALLLMSSTGDRVTWWALASVPLIYMATLVRFGAPIQTAAIGILTLVIRWEQVKRSKVVTCTVALLVAIGVYFILYVPSTLGTDVAPGAAIRELTRTHSVPSLWKGIRDYSTQAGLLLGQPSALVMALGLAWAFPGMEASQEARKLVRVFLAVSAGILFALSILVKAEYRYHSPCWPLAWIAGGIGLSRVLQRLSSHRLLAASLVAIPFMLIGVHQADFYHNGLAEREALRSAGLHVRASSGSEAVAVISGYCPEFAWYANARVALVDPGDGSLDWIPTQKVKPGQRFQKEFGANRVFLAIVQNGRYSPSARQVEEFQEGGLGFVGEFGSPSLGGRNYVRLFRLGSDLGGK